MIVAAGLLFLTQAPADAAYWLDLFPGLLAFGLGLGFSIMAVQVAAFSGVHPNVAGVAGGLVETSREIGGTFGVAAVATIAIARANDVAAAGGATDALTERFQRAALVAAAISATAAIAAGALLRRAERSAPAVVSPDRTPDALVVADDEYAA